MLDYFTYNPFIIIGFAIIFDSIIGDPSYLYKKIKHPVALFGSIINIFDRFANKKKYSNKHRKINGCFTIIFLICFIYGFTYLIENLISILPFGWVLISLLISIFIAQKSLYQHVTLIKNYLINNDIINAQKALSHIVGRDTQKLSSPDIIRATLESLAESFCDGVIAPIFWGLVLGLPGVITYKLINTADSMIGHLSDEYKYFGWASAKIDDCVNWLPARIAGIFLSLASLIFSWQACKKAFSIMITQAKNHLSPNAGWTESAMAGGLDIALGGPRFYNGKITELSWFNFNGDKNPIVDTLKKGINIYLIGCFINFLFIFIVCLIYLLN
ncbi:MAG: adenosylcobinamide-phosphate synthase CbiB [Alphaproteobacteria bacterium]|nr:adenosylcobinamide-phosphate synthase CbiB [Alphaproteobacteria bacterium]